MNKKRSIDHQHENSDINKKKLNIDNYGRKVWDKEYYQKKVDEKVTNEEDELILKLLPDLKKPKVPPVLSERKLLEERKENLSLEKNLGKVQILTQKTPKEEQGGFYCKICECVIKDSQTYLDHINGKNHNRMLGYSMKVKRVTLDDVKKKLSTLKDKKDNKTKEIEKDAYEEAKKSMKEIQEMEERKIQKRKEKKLQKKLEKKKRKEELLSKLEEDTIHSEIKELGLPTSFV
ncbi:zinc finger protein, putative [Plasmodium gallinaceum]|uniref:Zinc finger protein, putative n=1 Tax=Plasmodium gallinaceum TaxID=5849 RepID=A0A1J1H0K4_PLAGA|nr:zinc finger protein, putative [Plasmodium gallinaceum]CRG97058.1 zinc finger protein, putative [Plasmodium gallinaceum]